MTDQPARNFDLGIDEPGRHLSQTRQYLVGDILLTNARTRPDATAVVGTDGTTRTYGELEDRVNALANQLQAMGVDYGSTIAVVSENRPAFVEVIYAGAKLGAVVATMNWRQERDELLHCLDLAGTDAVVASGSQQEVLGWIQEADTDDTLVTMDDVASGQDYETLVERGDGHEPTPSTRPSPEDGVTIFYTSGTTGLPKGTVISHRAMIHRLNGWKLVAGVGPDFVAWPPMFHQVATEQLFAVGVDGGTFYTVDGFQPERILSAHTRADAGYVVVMPGTVQTLLDTAAAEGYTADDFESVSYVGVMADLVTPERIKAVTELFGADYVNTFGLTESSVVPLSGNTIPQGVAPTDSDLSKQEGPLCSVKLVDEDWSEVDVGEYGELAVRGPTLFSGYVGNREANQAEFNDGWFRTGDMFVRNANDTYDFVDRRKYLIKSGGENIYPAEIERVLLEDDAIDEAVVVRVPDDNWGEVPKAYVAPTADSSLEPTDVLDRLEGEIARYKLPHYVEITDGDEFPRSTTGKIIRNELEDWETDETQRVRDP